MMYRLKGTHGFFPETIPALPARSVIESFLLVDGTVRGLDLHINRFAQSVSVPADFGAMVRDCLPVEGEWFPRLEYHGADIYLRVRSAPPRRSVTKLWVPTQYDPRECPTVKGWDLPALNELRAEAVRQGCDDALLIHPVTRQAIETTTAALVVWVDGVIHTQEVGVLPSVTWRRTKTALQRAGIPVRAGAVSVTELRALPCAVGNALHGWTPVTAVQGCAVPPPPVDLNQVVASIS